MKNKKNLERFLTELNDDFTIGKNHMIDDLPNLFTRSDLMFFYVNRHCFWDDSDKERQLTFCLSMTELYLSVLLHIFSSKFEFQEDVHFLEYSILYGDLLSGAFASKLVRSNEVAILEKWLNLLSNIQKNLVAQSLDGNMVDAKRKILCRYILEELNFFDKNVIDEDCIISNYKIDKFDFNSSKLALNQCLISSKDISKILLGD